MANHSTIRRSTRRAKKQAKKQALKRRNALSSNPLPMNSIAKSPETRRTRRDSGFATTTSKDDQRDTPRSVNQEQPNEYCDNYGTNIPPPRDGYPRESFELQAFPGPYREPETALSECSDEPDSDKHTLRVVSYASTGLPPIYPKRRIQLSDSVATWAPARLPTRILKPLEDLTRAENVGINPQRVDDSNALTNVTLICGVDPSTGITVFALFANMSCTKLMNSQDSASWYESNPVDAPHKFDNCFEAFAPQIEEISQNSHAASTPLPPSPAASELYSGYFKDEELYDFAGEARSATNRATFLGDSPSIVNLGAPLLNPVVPSSFPNSSGDSGTPAPKSTKIGDFPQVVPHHSNTGEDGANSHQSGYIPQLSAMLVSRHAWNKTHSDDEPCLSDLIFNCLNADEHFELDVSGELKLQSCQCLLLLRNIARNLNNNPTIPCHDDSPVQQISLNVIADSRNGTLVDHDGRYSQANTFAPSSGCSRTDSARSANSVDYNPAFCRFNGIHEECGMDGNPNWYSCHCIQSPLEDEPHGEPLPSTINRIGSCMFAGMHEVFDFRGIPLWYSCACFRHKLYRLASAEALFETISSVYGSEEGKTWLSSVPTTISDTSRATSLALSRQNLHSRAQTHYPSADPTHEKACSTMTQTGTMTYSHGDAIAWSKHRKPSACGTVSSQDEGYRRRRSKECDQMGCACSPLRPPQRTHADAIMKSRLSSDSEGRSRSVLAPYSNPFELLQNVKVEVDSTMSQSSSDWQQLQTLLDFGHASRSSRDSVIEAPIDDTSKSDNVKSRLSTTSWCEDDVKAMQSMEGTMCTPLIEPKTLVRLPAEAETAEGVCQDVCSMVSTALHSSPTPNVPTGRRFVQVDVVKLRNLQYGLQQLHTDLRAYQTCLDSNLS